MHEEPDWESIVASSQWPQFLAMLAWFEVQAVKMTCVADTESKLYTAQGELRAYHGMQVTVETRAKAMKDSRERERDRRAEELDRNGTDSNSANRRGNAGAAGPRGTLASALQRMGGSARGNG